MTAHRRQPLLTRATPLRSAHGDGARTWCFRRSHLGTEADRATFRTLHEASLAGPALREGLTEASAERSIRHLRSLLGAPAVALTDTERVLAWDGLGAHHGDQVAALARGTESTKIAGHAELACHLVSCPVQQVILSPLVVDELLVGHLVVGTPYPTAGLVRATDEVACVGVRAARPGGARRLAAPAGRGRGARPAGADLAALHLQLAGRDRVVRADRPRAGPGPAAGVRRLHPVLLPPARRVHDAGRGAPVDRAVPAARAGAVRRAAAGRAPDRARGAAGADPVPLPPAAGRERRQARARGPRRGRHHHGGGQRPRPRVRDHHRGRRRRARTRTRYAGRWPGRRSRSVWPTSTSGCGTRSATSTGSRSRPPSAPARGSSCACPSTPRGCST